ncbi:MAG: gliding motility-associated C-terminal domain-containing protein, partial [Bacteroidota bacterium]
FTITLTVTYASGLCSRDSSITITVANPPTAAFTYLPQNPSIKNPNVSFSNASQNSSSWQWTFGSADSSSLENPSYSFPQYGSWNVQLIAFNDAGCTDTALQKIFIAPDVFINLPDAFTPNGDGNNDAMNIFHAGIAKLIDFRIYNRWGELVFQTTNINAGWDGTFRGKLQDTGTFVYYITAESAENNLRFSRKGTFTLIR